MINSHIGDEILDFLTSKDLITTLNPSSNSDLEDHTEWIGDTVFYSIRSNPKIFNLAEIKLAPSTVNRDSGQVPHNIAKINLGMGEELHKIIKLK